MAGYEDKMSPEMRKKYLAALNDPDLLTVKPEIKLLEEKIAELESRESADPDVGTAIAELRQQLSQLRKRQEGLEK